MPKLCVEYAKSGRAKCSNTACGKLICKGELRIGTEMMMALGDKEVESWKWRHLCCFTERQLSNAKASGEIDALQGESDLAPADRKLMQEMREGKLVGDVSILGRIGDVAPTSPPKKGKEKGTKATVPRSKGSKAADGEGPTPAPVAAKRQRAPSGKAKTAVVAAQDGDVDSEATEEYEVAVETEMGKPKCPYGVKCFRTEKKHFQQYSHEDGSGTATDAAGLSAKTKASVKPVIKRKKLKPSAR
ncbi:hypothetical protein JKF63_00123 [Porcisia hertigi]|uniref:PARP-type domain-containing protein n=1 Tax=Porcisia hertigi TaxID=2761500 RepID=A0A836HCK3_9TRYP|nr:hypothetical protein JKF63_00123 [Porcisia hertigi]